MPIVPAAPNALTTVATVLNTFCVVNAPTSVPLLTVVVLPIVLPMFTLVVLPVTPPVPRFTVFVFPVEVAPVPKLYVLAPVLALPMPIVCAEAVFARLRVVAAPNRLPVVAVVLARLKIAVLTVKSPPSMLTSPSTSRLLLTLVVPVAAPICMFVAAPAKFTVVALVLAKLNVVVLTVKSPPSMLTSPSTSKL